MTDDGTLDTDASSTAANKQYVVVARRYRPQSFTELIGQEHVGRGLSNAIRLNRVGHAYLFSGARGVGKTSSARILAKALNCVDGPTPTPCNHCEICQSISSGEDIDVLEIDGASNRGIDEIRQLRQNVNVRPSRARYKIYIIDEVHMLTREAFNALLKTLEEPPERVKFIFCTTEPEKIPITILSRCQRFDFAGIQAPSIVERLAQIAAAEGVEADQEALEIIARRAAGSMRDSQSLLEQLLAFGSERITATSVHQMLGTASGARLTQLLNHLAQRDAAQALNELDAALTEGVEVGQFLDQLLGYLRDCMAAAVGCKPEAFLNVSSSDAPGVLEISNRFGLETILAMIQILDQTLGRLRFSSHGRVLAEMALVRMSHLEDLQSLPNIIADLRNGVLPTLANSGDVDSKKKAPAPVKPAVANSAEPRATSPVAAAPAVETPSVSEATPQKSPPEPIASEAPVQATTAPETAPLESPPEPETSSPEPLSKPLSEPLSLAEELAASLTTTSVTPAVTTEATSVEPEPEPEPESPTTVVTTDISALNVAEVWNRAIDTVGGIAAEYGRYAQVEFTPATSAATACITATFPAQYISFKRTCEHPEVLSQYEDALRKQTGTEVRITFRVSEAVETPVKAPPARSRATAKQQRISELSKHPFVERALELFDAQIMQVEDPPEAKTP